MLKKVDRQSTSPLNVVVVTPLGEAGQGGVDRMMDAIRREFREHPRVNVDLQFVVSRGPNIYLSPVVLAWALLRIIYMQTWRGIDVIHINVSANASAYRKFVVAAVASALGIPYVVHLHSGEFGRFWDTCNGYTRRRIDAFFTKAKFVVVLGRVWSDLVVTKLPELADRIIVLPNSTKGQHHNFRSEGPVKILFLGRLSPAKALYDLRHEESSERGDEAGSRRQMRHIVIVIDGGGV